MVKTALFGYSGAGKTRVFRLLTGRQDERYDPFEPNVGVGLFRDGNLSRIAEIQKAGKTVYPEFEFFDFKGFPSEDGFPPGYFKKFFDMDIILGIVNNFRPDARPSRDMDSLLMELMFHDVERIEKILHDRTENNDVRDSLLTKAVALLGQDVMLNGLGEEERMQLAGMELLTVRPVSVYVNGCATPLHDDKRPFVLTCDESFDGSRLYEHMLERLSLKVFYTVKSGIARGWVIPSGFTARQAAGVIHKDIAEGFIKAAVVNCRDLLATGSWQQAKNAGILKFLGPNSSLCNGDVVEFYFRN